MFGLITFTVDKWEYGAPILNFTSGFDLNDVTNLVVPELIGKPGSEDGVVQFHKRFHGQALQAFRDLGTLNLIKYIHQVDAPLFPRLKKLASGTVSHEPSNHSFGIAIDLNEDELPLNTNDTGLIPGTVRPLAPTFIALGFRWLQNSGDPMHFEIATPIDHPSSSVKPVFVDRANTRLAIQAYLIGGHTMVSTADFAAVFGGSSRLKQGSYVVIIQTLPNGTEASFDCQIIENRAYSMVTLLAAAYGFAVSWNNGTRTVTIQS